MGTMEWENNDRWKIQNYILVSMELGAGENDDWSRYDEDEHDLLVVFGFGKLGPMLLGNQTWFKIIRYLIYGI